MAKVRAIHLSEAVAAGSLAPEDFLDALCVTCRHGKGQHKKVEPGWFQRLHQKHPSREKLGACTAPGCSCPKYLPEEEIIYGNS